MKKILKAISVVAALLPIAMGTAMAQVTEDGMGKVIPVELFACSFNGRQDQDPAVSTAARIKMIWMLSLRVGIAGWTSATTMIMRRGR
jgi:hypothetical protein